MTTACEDYGVLMAACYYGGDPTYAAYFQTYCDDYLVYADMIYGPACATAVEDVYACISGLACMDLPMIGAPGICDTEVATFNAVCI